MRFPQIPAFCRYSVILAILWSHNGLSVKKDLTSEVQPFALSVSDDHIASSSDTTLSGHQTDSSTAKHQAVDEHVTEPKKSNDTISLEGHINHSSKDVDSTGHETTISVLNLSTLPSSINVTPSSTRVSTSAVINRNSQMTENNLSSTFPTSFTPRKSKPEETHVDDIGRDSGPTVDYVVPLVVAMLAVPLIGVLCALLYLKGKDFWERRHYGRIDFLWDNRNDGDFLIDGMYNN